MAKSKQTSKSASPVDSPRRGSQSGSARETVESIVFAFVLAFLFRTFEAEAFVIPTGSMAPTLMGRHKDVHCQECGVKFEIGASDELNEAGRLIAEKRIDAARCPNCRFENNVFDLPVFKGDRILVNKFPYELADPDRWDVVVFKYPEGPATNYIKRLVGLPGERLKIHGGDVHSRDRSTGEISIVRKDDPYKQQEIQIPVYDNNHQSQTLRKAGWPRRWQAVRRSVHSDAMAGWETDDNSWQASASGTTFNLDLTQTRNQPRRWLRYRHIIPRPEDWLELQRGHKPAPRAPELIRDFCGYNAYTYERYNHNQTDYGSYWVGDLTLSCTVRITDIDQDNELLLELVEGPRWYRCRFNVSSGETSLSYIDRLLTRDTDPDQDEADAEHLLATTQTAINRKGTYRLRFANVDDRLCLWVNGDLITFDKPGTYQPAALLESTEDDRVPAGVAARGLGIEVSDLLIDRDIYYRPELAVELYGFESDPNYRHDNSDLAADSGWLDLNERELLVLGDNSPRSKDSRLWGNTRRAEHRWAVPQSALIGKAFFIYWPHGIPFLNDGRGIPTWYHRTDNQPTEYPSFRVPFYPQVWRMQRIH